MIVHIGIRCIVESVTAFFHRFEQGFGVIQEFGVGHYNFTMLKAKQILVSAIVLGAVVLNLAGCGQTGALYLPERASPKPFAPATPVVTPESKKP